MTQPIVPTLPARILPAHVLRTADLPWLAESGADSNWEIKDFTSLPLVGLRASLVRLLPGHTSELFHFHHFAEELVYILDGAATLRQGDGSGPDALVPVQAGDLCVFAPFSGGGPARVAATGALRPLAHQFINESSEPFTAMVVSEQLPHELNEYPDSGITHLRALGRRFRLQPGAYFDGEGDPLPTLQLPAGPATARARRRVARQDLPSNVVATATIAEKTWGKGQIGNSWRELGEKAGAVQLGLSVTRIAGGQASAPLHFHMADNELFYIVAGRGWLVQAQAARNASGQWATARVGESVHIALQVGDIVSFPPATGLGHQFRNTAEADLVYLAMGTDRREDVCVYPHSGKVLIGATRGLGWMVDADERSV